MKVVHIAFNGSGMHSVAATMAQAEQALGIDSHLLNMDETNPDELDKAALADVFVAHTHFPELLRYRVRGKNYKMVFPGHGTPENIFRSSVDEGKRGYGHGDGWMLYQYWMQHADAVVTFWPRHQAIMKSLCDKHTKVHLVPLGVDKAFWASGKSSGKYAGNPSLWSGENCHEIKWPMDLFIMWPWVYEQLDGASLHVNYLPTDQHRWFFPLVNRNGASYGCHISPLTWVHSELRNIFKSIDYFIGLVRYGDHNRLSLEASASGATTISYKGNVYSDFWLDEGDQRHTAEQLVKILKGEVEPRQKTPVPDGAETAQVMKEIYEGL